MQLGKVEVYYAAVATHIHKIIVGMAPERMATEEEDIERVAELN